MYIGNVKLDNNVFLAPMAGVTDRSFRLICKGFGCGLVCSEMVSAKSVVYGNANTKRLLDTDAAERPFAVQLFGHEPDIMAEAIRILNELPIDIFDINMGCPVPKVVRNGEGCALMNDLPLAGRIVHAAARAAGKPVTVKIRKGFSPANVNAVEAARVAEANGAAAVTVHGRTREQFYSGAADWNIIAAVKRAVGVPVIGNGDIFTPEAAAGMLEQTGCDAVMAARGAMGNPWLFKRTLCYLTSGELTPPPDTDELFGAALKHLRMAAAHKGERTGVLEMRRHMSWYIKGLPNAAAVRRLINAAASVDEMEDCMLYCRSRV